MHTHTFEKCTSTCTYVDKLDFQACSLATTEKKILLFFQSWASYHKLFPWSVVISNNFKALGLGFQSLAGENQHSSVWTTIWKVTNRLANAFKALKN